MTTRHPARYTNSILKIIKPYLVFSERIFDPFAGTGERLRGLDVPGRIILNELEPEWALQGPCDTIADTLQLPYKDNAFDAICVSPCYGNRMADHHEARDKSKRNTYRHTLGRPLHPSNSGQLQWGDKYKQFHRSAWKECDRVLEPGGLFILNVSDHIRNGRRMQVTMWHMMTFVSVLQYELKDWIAVPTPRMREGANSDLRVEQEDILIFRKPELK